MTDIQELYFWMYGHVSHFKVIISLTICCKLQKMKFTSNDESDHTFCRFLVSFCVPSYILIKFRGEHLQTTHFLRSDQVGGVDRLCGVYKGSKMSYSIRISKYRLGPFSRLVWGLRCIRSSVCQEYSPTSTLGVESLWHTLNLVKVCSLYILVEED